MNKFQANQIYYSDTLFLMAKVKSVNNTMCVGTFLEFDFDNETYKFQETFIISHEDLLDILKDGDPSDDDGGQAQIVFVPEFTFN